MQSLSFVGYFNDPLYGSVGYTQRELNVIQTKAFQRLKNIKQLGTVNFVYPGANHSRFEHSIGTMHVTSQIFDRLADRLALKQEHKQIVRLAALLHDIGHGPFSHTFEELLTRKPNYVPVINDKELSDHEDFTNYILSNNNELKEVLQDDLSKIVDFLFGTKIIDNIPSELITGDIGSDRVDYLLRDTYYTGLGHRPDVDSLISNMHISVKREGYPRLTLAEQGMLAAEFLITTRYYHFSMIVHNLKTRSVELLFLKLLEKLLEKQFDPREYIINAFTKYDDSKILNDLFESTGTWRDLFYSGKSFYPIYNIPLKQIRSGVTKYCIYRFFYDNKGLRDFISDAGKGLGQIAGLEDVLVDVHLFKHNVPDIILHADAYETKKEWISPFLVDQSNILRQIPAEQLRRSNICILKSEIPIKSDIRYWNIVEENREKFLSRDFLVPLTRKSIEENGFRLIDDFYTFLCALRDFYNEKPSKNGKSSSEELFRGITRFYDLLHLCYEKLQRPNLKFEVFHKSESTEDTFRYSTQGYSILNALSSLDILRLEYVPTEGKVNNGKPFHFVYLIRPIEKDIRKRVYDGLKMFETLREKFMKVFRDADWNQYFADFFPLKSEY